MDYNPLQDNNADIATQCPICKSENETGELCEDCINEQSEFGIEQNE